MKFLRVLIEGWTASFRYPAFISGFQPTLPVPPLSTIYGLLSSVKGDIVTPEDTSVAFVFDSEAKSVDLETIYELKGLTGNKSNVIKREFLFNNKLYLYLDNLDFKESFKKPAYPVLLGRSSDLAFIKEISEVELEKKTNVKLGKSILPFGTDGAFGVIQALPTHFSEDIPRKAMGTKPYILMDRFFEYSDECYFDDELDWGIWIHKK
ncbi:type I-B CRISPR-associated protein Cas5b [Methanobrevibacter millerae]|uniref:CRISPR-associated protein, Cas5t family n=1 Tax=Methanobrevibacter millerae TaxID=230361 RepID=A0A1G5VHB0_9EURY|nr:type I-B CRISPR-associated protein Cas5b [Methanobrevibacter millerae]SDA45220.1 CRISPR-associated protein, Cas5t family [Methanobrevibacter millerae]